MTSEMEENELLRITMKPVDSQTDAEKKKVSDYVNTVEIQRKLHSGLWRALSRAPKEIQDRFPITERAGVIAKATEDIMTSLSLSPYTTVEDALRSPFGTLHNAASKLARDREG